jgi:hypothetical protein
MSVYKGITYSNLTAINATIDSLSATAMAGTLTGNVDATTGYIQLRTATAANIAAIANAVNTTGKAAGTVVFDTTNSKIKVATGANANSTWVDADGTNAVTPS